MNYKIYKDYENYHIHENGDIFSLNIGNILKPRDAGKRYKMITLCNNQNRQQIYVHRLIGLLFLPNPENKPEIDHINRNRSDNRVENLRWATKSEQQHNQGISKDNTSGVKGVGYCKTHKKWVARLMVNTKDHKKRFESKEEAIAYRRELEIKYLGEGFLV